MPARRRALVCRVAAGLFALLASGLAISGDATRDRTISFYNFNTKESLTIQYMKDGKHIPEAMDKINWILRDWRRDEKTTMDPNLIDLVWEIHTELGSNEPIHIISGYRSRTTNDMLRRTVGGQASESRHILGKAMDIHFPDVPIKKLRYSALIRERGGVGYYPTSAIPFVHVDTDRVRAWPRVPRMELALLFPSGHSQHVPSDSGPITPNDVRVAMASNKELAAQMAEFHEQRAKPKALVQTASLASSLGPSLPQLLSLPKPVERPAGLGTRPSEMERSRLEALATADEPMPKLTAAPAPVARARAEKGPARQGDLKLAAASPTADPAGAARPGGRGTVNSAPSFVPAPAFDEEHPEELSYRPFPIAPLLTTTASVDDPALAKLVHPDLARILETIDGAGSVPPLRRQLKGEAANLSSFVGTDALPSTGPGSGLPVNRRVLTQAQ